MADFYNDPLLSSFIQRNPVTVPPFTSTTQANGVGTPTGVLIDPVTGSPIPSKDSSGISLKPVGAGVPLPSGLNSTIYSQYSRTKAGLAAVITGTAPAVLACFGDSTTAGWYAQSPTNAASAGDHNRAASMYLAAALNSVGIPAINENFFGDSGQGGSLGGFDSRLSLGSWVGGNVPTLGGATLLASSAASGSLVFTPNVPCDTFDVWYITFPSSTGNYTISMPGATTQSVSNLGTSGYARKTITGTLASALTVAWVSGNCHLAAVVGYNSQSPAVRVLNMGYGGGTSTTLTAAVNGYDPLPALAAFAADANARSIPLTVKMELGINDVTNGTGASQFATNMSLLGSTVAPYGDVLYSSFFPTAQSVNTLAAQRPYVTSLAAMAASKPALYIAKWESLGSQETQAAFGIFNNTKHPQYPLLQTSGQGDARAFLSIAT